MIREAIARHRGGSSPAPPPAPPAPARAEGIHIHASHSLFVLSPAPDGDCVIEPGHRCDHCGYCKSLGH